MRVPSSTPGGILTDSVRSRVTRPAPEQVGQGSSITWPRPWQAGQVRSSVKKPCAWRMRPAPPQVAQVFGLVPALAPVPEQASQVTEVGMRHLRGLALEGLLEPDLHIVAQIGAALAAGRAAAAAPAAHAEHILENIGEGGAEIGAEAGPAAAALLEGGMAETVIGGALVAVLEHLIGLVDFLELVLALGVARIAVRVMLHRELAEGGLEFDLGARRAVTPRTS